MKIYISVRPFVPGKSGGIVGYLENVVTALAAIPGIELHTGHSHANLNEIGTGWPSSVQRHSLHGIDLSVVATIERSLIDRLEPDWVVYFYPFFYNYYPANGKTRVATCLPDIQHVHLGTNFTPVERRDRDLQFTESIEHSAFIFTLSDFCRDDIARHYPRAAGRIHTIYPAAAHAWDHPLPAGEGMLALREKHHLPGRFALYNANPWPHKNHDSLLAALRLLSARIPDIACVLTGADNQGTLRGKISALGLDASVKSLGYVNETDLKQLMAAAELLVFPSLFEGFGIPVLEAFGLGLPVACSNVCSLPEVGGDAAEYFDPSNPEDIARAIELLWQNPELRAVYQQRGLARYREFSYEKSAARLAELFTQPAASGTGAPAQVREPTLVSIVTPSYQQGRFLRACIESVLHQDYPHVEYRVMDGGSTDESVSILKSYGTRFPWQSQPDGGQTSAINAGLAQAKGSILAYLNSDDVLQPSAISKMVEAFNHFPSADLIYGQADYIDEEGRVTQPYTTHPHDQELLKGLCYICQPAAFWTRRAWERYGEFDASFNFAMDYEYWQRLSAGNAFIHHIPEKIAASRDYATTKTRGQRQKVFDDIFATQRKHWNHIHLNWWLGYIDYLAKEAPWWERVRTPRSPTAQQKLAAKLAAQNDRRPPAPPPKAEFLPRIIGIYNDGWLAPDFNAVIRTDKDRIVYLELQTPWAGEFALVVDGRSVATTRTEGPARFRLETVLPAGERTLELKGPSERLSEADSRGATALLLGANWL